jgi:hypothetical protein
MATGTGKTLVAFQVCLVIVDECHRGSAKDDSSWREILAYFAPAVQIGMTATPPARRDPRHLPLFRKPGLSVQSQAGHRRRFPRAVPCPSRCHAKGCLRMAPQQGRPRPQEPARQRGQHAPAAGTTGRKHSGEGTADCGDYGEDRGSAGRASEGVTFSR